MELDTIENLLMEINHLKEAEELLEEIWGELGPYTDKLSMELLIKLQRFMNFDDSE